MKRMIFLWLILVLSAAPLLAGTTGKIAGRVVDKETKQPLPGVNILIEGTTLGAATDQKGEYVILNIPPGRYSLRAMMIGYKPLRVQNVRVRIDLTTRVNFELEQTVLQVGEGVTIVAERPIIQKDLTSSQTFVDAEQLQEMPVENFFQVLELQAGVVRGSGGELHMRGGRSGEIAYMIDGVSVTDPYSYSMAVPVENNAIQELQIVSGTFNAEYGQAMSGIVNIVTKEGGKNYAGDLSIYAGDYFTRHNDIFIGLDDYSPKQIYDFQGSLSGPMPKFLRKMTFFLSGRLFNDEGYLYGIRRYMPSDSNDFSNIDSTQWHIEQSGDGKLVPMNPNRSHSLQWKFALPITPSLKLTYGGLWNRRRFKYYSHKFKLNPEGTLKRFSKRYNHIFTLTHTLSSKTYYSLRYSRFFNDYRHYAYKNPLDPRYVHPDRFKTSPGYRFYTGGVSMNHLYRNTTTNVYKFEITSQVNAVNQVKAGLEYRWNKLYYETFNVFIDWTTNFKPTIPDLSSPAHDKYIRYPKEFSAFIQDKLEYNSFIVNFGVRYDYFDPDGVVLSDPRDPNINLPIKPEHAADDLATRRTYWYKKAKPKFQVSPRLGVAYPITDKGVIHFSYGHFLQIPPYAYLYANPEFEAVGDLSSVIGNADLEPQRTVSYEIGLQQEVAPNLAVEITGYYKDIRNLLGTKIVETYNATHYAVYINRDYGNVRGVVLSLKKRYSNYISGQIDYTYGVAEGNASNPLSAFFDAQAHREPETQLVYLDWDQTHTLNASVTISDRKRWGISFVGQYGSGLPYTPTYRGLRTSFENSERKPPSWNVDLRSHYDFTFNRLRLSLYLLVYNLFDHLNENYVYTDTGRATYTLISTYEGRVYGPNTLEEYLLRPDYFSPPREIRLGLSVQFQ